MEHVEVLERLRGVLEHGKMGDKCLIAPDLVTAAIAALSAPQPTEARGVVDEGSRSVTRQLLHWGGVPVHVTGTVTTSPGNWSLIDAAPQPPAEAQAQGGGDVAMEAWHAAVNDAGELRSNAPDERYARRAANVESWIKANRPAPPSAPVGVEAIKSAIAELDALRNAMFKTYAAAANGADKTKLICLIEAERDAYEAHYSLPKLQEALAQQPAAPTWIGIDWAEGQQPAAAGEMAELVGLLDEVRSHFTRDDDLPDDLLPRIDAALAAQPKGVGA